MLKMMLKLLYTALVLSPAALVKVMASGKKTLDDALLSAFYDFWILFFVSTQREEQQQLTDT